MTCILWWILLFRAVNTMNIGLGKIIWAVFLKTIINYIWDKKWKILWDKFLRWLKCRNLVTLWISNDGLLSESGSTYTLSVWQTWSVLSLNCFFFRNLKNMEIITEKDKLLNIKEIKNLTSHTVTELKNK